MIKRALIVDHEKDDGELIQNILRTTGVESVVLNASADAHAYFVVEHFGLILLNLHLPPPDGLDLTREIRRPGMNQSTPIVMLSDDPDPASVSQGFEAGANFFIYKPIDHEKLTKVVRVTQGTAEHERRRFRRVPLRAKVQLKIGQVELDGETIDVSLNGLLVKAERMLSTGSTARFSLQLSPGIRPVVGLASVRRHIGKQQMGIQLDRLAPDESRRLEQFLLPLVRHDWPMEAASAGR